MGIDPLLVATAAGAVRGRREDGVLSWRGVPCAAAERFAPAGPPPSWEGVRDATGAGPVALQRAHDGSVVGVEACLTVDVHAPDGAGGALGLLPVLVWVHGGAFRTGSPADYDPTPLAASGRVVVVSAAYRLGALGFLALGTAGRPAPSPAITDLVAALDWVDREVAAFGGDRERVALVGQSAGASLVVDLLGTRAGARARAVVALSCGGAPVPAAEAVDVTARVLDELDLPAPAPGSPVPAPVVAALRALPAEDLLVAAEAVSGRARRERMGGVVFGPVVDGAVLTAAPDQVLSRGERSGTALWFGWCRDEMATFTRAGSDDAVAVARARTGADAWDALERVYRRTATPGEDPVQRLLTDEAWVQPVLELAGAHARAGGRVWTSRFDHVPGGPGAGEAGPDALGFAGLGAAHGADNACLWARPPRFVERPLLGRPAAVMGPSDASVARALVEAVLAAVADGRPSAPELPGWEPWGPGETTAVFADPCRVEAHLDAERRSAWAAVGAQRPPSWRTTSSR